jgi:hypothetical protein
MQWPFGIFCGHLVYFMAVCYILSRFGKMYLERSGNPAIGGLLTFAQIFGLFFSTGKVLYHI